MEDLALALVALFAVASVVALIAKRFGFPYTIGLVVAGLVIGATQIIEPPRLTQHLLYAVFLPGLLFEAAFHLDVKDFLANRKTILVLAIPGVVAAVVLTAALLVPMANGLHFVTDFAFPTALVFAAIIAATDPLAVIGIFKSLGAPRRLAVLVEGESLLNDGTAVVIFSILLAFATGGDLTVGGAILEFVKVAGLGLLVGGGLGYAIARLTARIDEPTVEITLTTIAAYGSFAIAESVHVSGVIATVVAGMVCGNFAERGMSARTRVAAESFWEYLGFALNSIVFLLIGSQLRLEHLLASWLPIVAAFAAVTFGRALVITLVTTLLRGTREGIPASWAAVLAWGGLRGGLSMVLVLTLPEDFPHRELLTTMTFGVVFLSILLQGLSMPWLLKRLGVVGAEHARHEYEMERGRLLASGAALDELDAIRSARFAHHEIVDAIHGEYALVHEEAQRALGAMHTDQERLREEEEEATRRRVILAEKEELVRARRAGVLSEHAFETLMAERDSALAAIEYED